MWAERITLVVPVGGSPVGPGWPAHSSVPAYSPQPPQWWLRFFIHSQRQGGKRR